MIEADIRAMSARLRLYRFAVIPDMLDAMAARVWPPAPDRYGDRRVPKMYREFDALRKLIRAEGTPAIQDAFDKLETNIDFAYGRNRGGE